MVAPPKPQRTVRLVPPVSWAPTVPDMVQALRVARDRVHNREREISAKRESVEGIRELLRRANREFLRAETPREREAARESVEALEQALEIKEAEMKEMSL